MGQKIQIRRGNEANLPELANGEMALTVDTKKVFIGHPDGNIPVSGASAGSISVDDPNNHFTGEDVESVLEELFTFANDGKTAVANAITAQNVAASPTDTFSVLADKIGQIFQGKKIAFGNAADVVLSGTNYTYPFTIPVSLSFTPTIVIVYVDDTFQDQGATSTLNYPVNIRIIGDSVIPNRNQMVSAQNSTQNSAPLFEISGFSSSAINCRFGNLFNINLAVKTVKNIKWIALG